MELEDIAINICMEMRKTKAKERKVSLNFSTAKDGTQSVYFTVFWNTGKSILDINKYLSFYDFQGDEHHKENLQKVKKYLRHQINEDQLFNQ